MPEWSPEIVVEEPLARQLLAAQFPGLEVASMRLAGEGWDNTAWLVDERWLFRFPRREIALDGIARELARAARARAAATPADPAAGLRRPAEPGVSVALLRRAPGSGRELAEARLDDDGRAALARPLGRFLRALHEAEIPVELPVDPISRADMRVRVPRARERLAELGYAPPGADDVLAAGIELPPPERLTLVHCDLHLRHAFVENGQLSGVIDWGDVCQSDPAVDLVLVWCTLPPAARHAFFDEYGPVPESGLLRARVLSLFLCAVLALHARQEGLELVEREAIGGLDRTLES